MQSTALGLFLAALALFGAFVDAKTNSRRVHHLHDEPAATEQSQSFGPDIFRNFFKNRVLPQGGAAYNYLAGQHPVAPYFVPVPIVVPPPPPPPPGPKCYSNKSGYLCCNVTLENTMYSAYEQFKRSPKYSACNVHRMAAVMGDAAENRFSHTFETIAAHKDFVAKSRFSGDLNCKIEVDGKYFLAYATPTPFVESDVNIIDGTSFFGFGPTDDKTAAVGKQIASKKNRTGPSLVSGTSSSGKPTYLLYGPLR